ncbi:MULTISPECIES: hypothetical protein [unclassified Streptomyces]|uniref:hypothetical protein n=1 Tax=unclassified Streptomyces TaxID=2593676 RepID=UPI003D728CA0
MPRSVLDEYTWVTGPARQKTTSAPSVDMPDPPSDADTASEDGSYRLRRRQAAACLGEFRRTAVLLPLSADGAPLTADFGGVRWILAFSNEAMLAGFAASRGEASREWDYDRVLGARLLDAVIPAMPVPYGVALDAGTDGEGLLFPPVSGIVPDSAAVDSDVVSDETDWNGGSHT